MFLIWIFGLSIWTPHSLNRTLKASVREGCRSLLFGCNPWDSCSKWITVKTVNNCLDLTCIFTTSKCPTDFQPCVFCFQSCIFWLEHYLVQIWSLSYTLIVDEVPFSAGNVGTLLLSRDELYLVLLNLMKFQSQLEQGKVTKLFCIHNTGKAKENNLESYVWF